MIWAKILYIPLKKGIWFTGGRTGYRQVDGATLAITEIMNHDGKITTGPKLPNRRHGHCQVSHDNLIFLIGEY